MTIAEPGFSRHGKLEFPREYGSLIFPGRQEQGIVSSPKTLAVVNRNAYYGAWFLNK
jgi:hypothetical protein